MTEAVPEANLLRDFAIIMAVAAGALVLFRRMGLPPILGYLLAGVLIGPFTFANPPIGDVDTIRLLAELGLVLILFSLGLEFGWERIRRLGVTVVFIGALEISAMIALGYGLGRLMGWDGTESVFLGSAMAISSSAILIKVLKDSGQLHGKAGRVIVGILVVEDFAAVLLLAVLSGVATTGTSTMGDIGSLVGKLAIFSVAALVFGAIIAPRLIDLVAGFRSREMLLISSLGMAFGLALLGEELGISAAAGAFLIGTVLGDTKHAHEISTTLNPIRDMFAAIFFVSIGMLVDVGTLADFIGPACAVAGVFIAGKVIANSIGALLAGHKGKDALAVGMGTPQVGEFSLAIANVGVAQGAVGAALFPVITVATAITSVAYPFIFKSSAKAAAFLDRYAPMWSKELVGSVQLFSQAVKPTGRTSASRAAVRTSLRSLGLNMGIIIILVAVGTLVLRSARDVAEALSFGEDVVGLIIGGVVILFSVPSTLAIWRSTRSLGAAISSRLLAPDSDARGGAGDRVRTAAIDAVSIVLIVFVALWTLPLLFELFALGGLAIAVPISVIAIGAAMTTSLAFKVHRLLEATFGRTFFGDGTKPDDRVSADAAADG